MPNKLNHIALILDGNKRWAKKNNQSNIYGYTKGFENIRNLVKFSLSKKLSNLTIFALSSENFNRTSINIIYDIIYEKFSITFNDLVKQYDVRINIFGDRKELPKKILEIFNYIESSSSKNNKLNLNIAFNYGFKNEIKNIFNLIIDKKIDSNFINQNDINSLFSLGSIPDPDILIRTGESKRLSNFLLWQLAYSEIFFEKKLWPDFKEKDFIKIINKYKNIKRNFGNI